MYEDAYFSIDVLGEEPIARVRRTDKPFPTIEEAARAFGSLTAFVDRMPPHIRAVLLDFRHGPGRNDPEFEALVGRVRERLVAPFAHRAMVLRTATGLLQSRRLQQQQRGIDIALFDDFDAALEHLRAAVGRGTMRP